MVGRDNTCRQYGGGVAPLVFSQEEQVVPIQLEGRHTRDAHQDPVSLSSRNFETKFGSRLARPLDDVADHQEYIGDSDAFRGVFDHPRFSPSHFGDHNPIALSAEV